MDRSNFCEFFHLTLVRTADRSSKLVIETSSCIKNVISCSNEWPCISYPALNGHLLPDRDRCVRIWDRECERYRTCVLNRTPH